VQSHIMKGCGLVAGLSQATARSAERAEKFSNVLEGSGTFERILEASRKPGDLYIYRCMGW